MEYVIRSVVFAWEMLSLSRGVLNYVESCIISFGNEIGGGGGGVGTPQVKKLMKQPQTDSLKRTRRRCRQFLRKKLPPHTTP